MDLDLADCRCIYCRSCSLIGADDGTLDPSAIHRGAMVCRDCGAAYDVIWGVPYLGVFETGDLLSLIEIAANAENYQPGRGSGPPTQVGGFDDLHALLEGYHGSPCRAAFRDRQGRPASVHTWLPHRYRDFFVTRALLADLPLQGRRALDAGAGTGFDASLLVRRGARVTAVDFSPLLAGQGRTNLPEARWLGGSARFLPFRDGVFDLVMATHALHHMRDLPLAIGEMLRVLRPGGWLIATGDPFRPDVAGEDFELRAFNDHPAVLQGVNEQIPRFREFTDTLKRHRDCLDIELFTVSARKVRAPGDAAATMHLLHPRLWELDEALARLPQARGVLALRIRVREPIQVPPAQPGAAVIGAGEFAANLGDQAQALAALARRMPAHLVNLPLGDAGHARFRLLNGWKQTVAGADRRTAYARARLFLARTSAQRFLNLEVLAPHLHEPDEPELSIWIDGRPALRRPLLRGLWTRVSLPVEGLPANESIAFEVRLGSAGATVDFKTFEVRRFALAGQPLDETASAADLERHGLEALDAVGMLGAGRVQAWFGCDLTHAYAIIGRLRALGREMDAIVADGMQPFFSCEEDVRVIGVYPDPVLSPSAPLTAPDGVRLVVVAEANEAAPLAEQVRCRRGPCYLVLPGGAIAALPPPAADKPRPSLALRLFKAPLRRARRVLAWAAGRRRAG